MDENEIDSKEFYRIKDNRGKFISGYKKSVWSKKGAAVNILVDLKKKGAKLDEFSLVIYTATSEISALQILEEREIELIQKSDKKIDTAARYLHKHIKPGSIIKLFKNSWKGEDTIVVRTVNDFTIEIYNMKTNKGATITWEGLSKFISIHYRYEIV
jgi:hypothetical protein